MRSLTLAAVALLLLVPTAFARDKAEKATLVKPLKVWEGRFDPDMPASGETTIDLITDAKGFSIPWRLLRWGQKVPEINFADQFVVLLVYPGGQYVLDGLHVDRAGDAKVAGSGIEKAVAVPKGKWYVLAIFPRDKVTSVAGTKLPTAK